MAIISAAILGLTSSAGCVPRSEYDALLTQHTELQQLHQLRESQYELYLSQLTMAIQAAELSGESLSNQLNSCTYDRNHLATEYLNCTEQARALGMDLFEIRPIASQSDPSVFYQCENDGGTLIAGLDVGQDGAIDGLHTDVGDLSVTMAAVSRLMERVPDSQSFYVSDAIARSHHFPVGHVLTFEDSSWSIGSLETLRLLGLNPQWASRSHNSFDQTELECELQQSEQGPHLGLAIAYADTVHGDDSQSSWQVGSSSEDGMIVVQAYRYAGEIADGETHTFLPNGRISSYERSLTGFGDSSRAQTTTFIWETENNGLAAQRPPNPFSDWNQLRELRFDTWLEVWGWGGRFGGSITTNRAVQFGFSESRILTSMLVHPQTIVEDYEWDVRDTEEQRRDRCDDMFGSPFAPECGQTGIQTAIGERVGIDFRYFCLQTRQ